MTRMPRGARRGLIIALPNYRAGLRIGCWQADAARILAGRIENEHT